MRATAGKPHERGGAAGDARFDHAAALAACAAGDQAALRRLYEHEAAQLLGVAQRIVRRRDLAQDVVHDAFVQIWLHAGSFDPGRGSGRGWIYSIVRHRALNLVRNARFEAALDEPAFEAAVDQAEPVILLEQLAEQHSLRRCLEALDEPRRRSLLLAYVDGLSHTEIALRLQAPLGTVKAWIRRGLLALRDCLA